MHAAMCVFTQLPVKVIFLNLWPVAWLWYMATGPHAGQGPPEAHDEALTVKPRLTREMSCAPYKLLVPQSPGSERWVMSVLLALAH